MNDLRMYVEHLFEGKTMTAEMIELKEEIYGNLVARYEDYLSQGLSDAEALDRTKKSLTSIDEMTNGTVSSAPEKDGRSRAVTGPRAGAPISPMASETLGGTSPDRPRRKVWPLVLAIVAVLVLIPVVLGVSGLMLFGSSTVGQKWTDADAAGNGTHVEDDAVTVDADGTVRYDGDPADALTRSVVAASHVSVSEYSGTSPNDPASIQALARTLPLSDWMAAAHVAVATNDQLVLTYTGVPDSIDGDSVDLAMVYNASAFLIAMPTLESVQISVSESDEPRDYDAYAFTRKDLEERYGFKLESSLLSDQGWKKLKEEGLYRGGFAERAVDAAEIRW